MGTNQSKTTREVSSHEKAVIECLRSMQLQNKESSDEGYVYVQILPKDQGGAVNEKADERPRLARDASLSVSQMQEWQSNLLLDPKSR